MQETIYKTGNSDESAAVSGGAKEVRSCSLRVEVPRQWKNMIHRLIHENVEDGFSYCRTLVGNDVYIDMELYAITVHGKRNACLTTSWFHAHPECDVSTTPPLCHYLIDEEQETISAVHQCFKTRTLSYKGTHYTVSFS